ncbi:MAG: hypothetical protein ACJAYE_001696 [Candidatus Azotimanducaceae bacterium]|jgi:hypothetical protein
MSISLYDITVTTYLQELEAVSGFMEKARRHFESAGTDSQLLVDARLCDDMLPMSFQINSVTHHSAGAVDALASGIFTPPPSLPDTDYSGLQELVAGAKTRLQSLDRDVVDGYLGKDVIFEIGDRRMPFIAEDFILSFSIPNFFFHATTAYDLLRSHGVPIGKRDFLGTPRMKQS